MGATSELPHGGRGGRLGRTRHLRLCRHLRHLEVLMRRARLAAAPTFALAVAAAFLLPGGQGGRLGSRGGLCAEDCTFALPRRGCVLGPGTAAGSRRGGANSPLARREDAVVLEDEAGRPAGRWPDPLGR